ncbi:hypothetical protein Hanom_Chr16g01447251 [Helianthus anomalus]
MFCRYILLCLARSIPFYTFHSSDSRTRNGPVRPSQFLKYNNCPSQDQRKDIWSHATNDICANNSSFGPLSVIQYQLYCSEKARNNVQSHSSFNCFRSAVNSQLEASYQYELRQEKGWEVRDRKPDLQLRLIQNKRIYEENSQRSTHEINTMLSLFL